MTNITIYDTDASILRYLTKKYNTTMAELIQTFIDTINDNEINLEDYGYKQESINKQGGIK